MTPVQFSVRVEGIARLREVGRKPWPPELLGIFRFEALPNQADVLLLLCSCMTGIFISVVLMHRYNQVGKTRIFNGINQSLNDFS